MYSNFPVVWMCWNLNWPVACVSYASSGELGFAYLSVLVEKKIEVFFLFSLCDCLF